MEGEKAVSVGTVHGEKRHLSSFSRNSSKKWTRLGLNLECEKTAHDGCFLLVI